MGMAMSVSIIVPVYNVEEYIADCFQSIINQTYTGPMECLFIDDCSTDKSIEILNELIDSYAGSIEMRILQHEKNGGPSVARNTGIRDSEGDYIFFLDSDDRLYPDAIETFVNAVKKENGADIVLGGFKASDQNHSINRFRYGEFNVIDRQPEIARAFLCDTLYCMSPNKLIRRHFIIDNQLWFTPGILQGEDNLWSFQCFHMAQKVMTIPVVTYYYVMHPNSITKSTEREKQIICAKKVIDEVAKDVDDHRYKLVEKDSQEYLDTLMRTKCGGLLNQIYMSGLPRKERLSRLKCIPEDIKSLMAEYLFTTSPFMRVMKQLFKYNCFGPFDQVMNRMYAGNA